MTNIIICKNCVHYTLRGECKVFKYIDLVTGNNKNYSAYQARYSTDMCTRDGYYYKTKERTKDIPLNIDKTHSHVIICSTEGGCGVIANPNYIDNSSNRYEAFLNSDDEY
jgi:hypothetical protein